MIVVPKIEVGGEGISPWMPDTDRLNLAVLGKMAEECCEAGNAAARCIIQGIDESEPVTGKPNRQMLEDEIADVLAVTLMASSHFGLDYPRILERADKKRQGFQRWHKMIRSGGA